MNKDLKLGNKPNCKSRKVVAKSRLFAIESLDLEFSNGQTRQYERLVRPSRGAVLIIPMLNDNTILLVKEYAAGTEQYELGFPKGLIDEGETSFDAANRELKEEVGYGARQFKFLKALSSSPSYFGLMVDLIVANDLYAEKLQGDEPEPLELVPWPISNIDQLLDRDDFSEARSVSAIYLLKKYLQEKRGQHGK